MIMTFRRISFGRKMASLILRPDFPKAVTVVFVAYTWEPISPTLVLSRISLSLRFCVILIWQETPLLNRWIKGSSVTSLITSHSFFLPTLLQSSDTFFPEAFPTWRPPIFHRWQCNQVQMRHPDVLNTYVAAPSSAPFEPFVIGEV